MSGHADDKSQQRPAGMAPRGFQSSRPFQPQPQPLSLNTTSAGPRTSMRSASSSISSTSSTSPVEETIFSPSLLSPLPTATSALLSPLSPSSPTDAGPVTHIHKNADGSLLMNSNYMSPASPVGEGFLDPRTMRRGAAARAPVRTTGGVVLGRRAPAAPRLHMDLQVSGGAELNVQVRGKVDMIFINTQGPHGGARR